MTDIVDTVKRYVPELKQTGLHWTARCPFHEERTPSFVVNETFGQFYCFGCQARGDAAEFLARINR